MLVKSNITSINLGSFSMLITFIFGCASSLQAIWEGTCTFEDSSQSKEIDVTADVRKDNGYVLDGEMVIIDWENLEYRSSLNGDYSGKYVSMRSDIETGLGLYRFQLEVVRVGTTLEGDCYIKNPESPGGLQGYIELER
jgi:hypothetical protein